MVLMEFRGAYDYLSNFYPSSIEFDGITYCSAEAAFQAQKCVERKSREQFAGLTAVKARHRGRQVSIRADWEQIKLSVMEQIVRAKFTQHPELAGRLMSTGDLQLVEGNAWHDTFWGVDLATGKGENHLGLILMKIRAELLTAA